MLRSTHAIIAKKLPGHPNFQVSTLCFIFSMLEKALGVLADNQYVAINGSRYDFQVACSEDDALLTQEVCGPVQFLKYAPVCNMTTVWTDACAMLARCLDDASQAYFEKCLGAKVASDVEGMANSHKALDITLGLAIGGSCLFLGTIFAITRCRTKISPYTPVDNTVLSEIQITDNLQRVERELELEKLLTRKNPTDGQRLSLRINN